MQPAQDPLDSLKGADEPDGLVGPGFPEDGAALAALGQLDPPGDLPVPYLTPNAEAVLERRYLQKGSGREPTETPRQLFWRVASHVARAELVHGAAPQALEQARAFYRALAGLKFLPNSPTLHNAGRDQAQLSACFVLPILPGVEGMFRTLESAARVHATGGGTGFDFSDVPPRGSGTSEGPVAMLRAFSATLLSVKQGGFRAGANMGMLRIDHPDVLEFIHAKDELGQMENFNVSIAVTEAFLSQLDHRPDSEHKVRDPLTQERSACARDGGGTWSVREVWDELVRCAHATGEPGLFFVDRVAAKNPVPGLGPIRATNPCGEQPLHDNDSCNLGSINLTALVDRAAEGAADFDWEALRALVRLAVRFLDDVVEMNCLPLEPLRAMSARTRRIGLGVMGFADTLYLLRLPYDCEEACAFGGRVMSVIAEEAERASAELAQARGSFGAWETSVFGRRGQQMRNAFRTTVAPTGTISILAGCSGGIEPLFSLAFVRQVMRDESGDPVRLTEVNPVFKEVALEQGFWSEALVQRLLAEGTAAHIEEVPELLREVFVTARDVAPEWHLAMQAAFQEHCDSGISKTINFPAEASLEDVAAVFKLATEREVVGLTCYRDGSRAQQPMTLTSGLGAGAVPSRVPEIAPSLRIRQPTPFGTMHVEVSVDPVTDRELEVFAQLGKGGELANSDLEAICRLLSLWLRSGGGIELALEQLRGIGATPGVAASGPQALSLGDGLAKALTRYLEAKHEHGLEAMLLGRIPEERWSAPPAGPRSGGGRASAERCPSCAGDLVQAEGCENCPSCGWAQC